MTVNEVKRTIPSKIRRHLLRLLLLRRRGAAATEIHGNGETTEILIAEVVVGTIMTVTGLLLHLFENGSTNVDGLVLALLLLFLLIETAVVDILLLTAVRLRFHLISARVEMTMMAAAVEALEVVSGTVIEDLVMTINPVMSVRWGVDLVILMRGVTDDSQAARLVAIEVTGGKAGEDLQILSAQGAVKGTSLCH